MLTAEYTTPKTPLGTARWAWWDWWLDRKARWVRDDVKQLDEGVFRTLAAGTGLPVIHQRSTFPFKDVERRRRQVPRDGQGGRTPLRTDLHAPRQPDDRVPRASPFPARGSPRHREGARRGREGADDRRPHLRIGDGGDLHARPLGLPRGRRHPRRERLRLHRQPLPRPREVRRRGGLLRHGERRGRREGAGGPPERLHGLPRVAREPDAPDRRHRGDLAPHRAARRPPRRRQHVLLALPAAAVPPRGRPRHALADEVRERPFDVDRWRAPRPVPVHEDRLLPLVQGHRRHALAVRLVARTA